MAIVPLSKMTVLPLLAEVGVQSAVESGSQCDPLRDRETHPFSAKAIKPPISAAATYPETHPFFGTLFCVPDSRTFWRNAASSRLSGQIALKSAAEFERFAGLA